MTDNYLYGIITGGGFLGVIVSIIAWIRNRKKDKAEAGSTEAQGIKTLAEAYQIKINAEAVIIEQWKKLTDELRGQIEEERKECDIKIQGLHKRIAELEKNSHS